jgi:hypothetical protein
MIRFCTRAELTADLDRILPPDEPMAVLIVTVREICDRMKEEHNDDMEYEDAATRVPFVEPAPARVALALERIANSMERRDEDRRVEELALAELSR